MSWSDAPNGSQKSVPGPAVYWHETEYGIVTVGSAKKFICLFRTMAVVVLGCLRLHSKTVLSDCIVTAVLSVCLKKEKTLSKLVNFCAAILILKMEENMQHFWYIMPYYVKTGKNTTEMQKKDSRNVWRRCYD